MSKASGSTAFVLSGGASLGAVQVGMLEALYEAGISPDLVVGTSVGALNGAFIAARPPDLQTVQELAAVWRGLSRSAVFPISPMAGLLGFMGARSHLVSDRGVRRLIERQVPAERLEDTPIPLHVVATDVLLGDDVRLSEGPLVDAVLASAAIPGVLPPVDWEGRLLMDGGVANNAPISHALELGARRIYVLPTGAPCELKEPPRGALAMVMYASGLLVGRRLTLDMSAVPAGVELLVIPPPCPIAVQPVDFSRSELLIRQGYLEASRFLATRPTRRTRSAPGARSAQRARISRRRAA